MCYPRSLEVHLGAQLPLTFLLDPKEFDHVLMVVKADEGTPSLQGQLRWSMVPAAWLYRQTTTETKSFAASAATAVNKVDEAFLVAGLRGPDDWRPHTPQGMDVLGAPAGVEVGSGHEDQAAASTLQNSGPEGWSSPLSAPRLGTAIDLGAAPGGWTMYLSSHVRRVIAVDPAELAPEALRENVIHLRLKSDCVGAELREVLGDEQVDLLVCDMNQHPEGTARTLLPLLYYVRPGGAVIMTMKFFGLGRERLECVRRVNQILQEYTAPGSCHWLLANTVHERTYVTWRL